MRKIIRMIRSFNFFIRLLLFLFVASLVTVLVIWLKPTDPDAYANAGKNQLWWIGITLLNGFIAVMFFGKGKF